MQRKIYGNYHLCMLVSMQKDAEATLKLWQRLETELYAQELTDIFKLESRLFLVL